MRDKKILWIFLAIVWLSALDGYGQRTNIREHVRIDMVPDHDDWTYRVGEKASVTLSVTKSNVPLKNVSVTYEIGPEKMPPVRTGVCEIREDGHVKLELGSMDIPGFLTCRCEINVDGLTYQNYLNIGFEPLAIEPTTFLPDDFVSFWSQARQETQAIPMEPLITLLPDECTPVYNMYHVRIQHYKPDTYLYGTLCVPVKPGKYPAVLRVPGAGVKKNKPEIELAEMGMITFSIGVHGIPQTLDAAFYDNLRYGVLDNYAFYLLDDKDHYYYRRVYTGCLRALDFLCSLPEYDGENVGVIGASQGGALALVTAGLDDRIKAVVAYHPALCDLTGYLYGRAGGWPHLFAPQNAKLNNKPEKIETSRYYDVVNFCRFVKAPGFYSWGFNDAVCPPTSYYSAYNVIEAPKRLFVAQETAHWRIPEQDMKVLPWLYEMLTRGTSEIW